jgi:hypothetical protein
VLPLPARNRLSVRCGATEKERSDDRDGKIRQIDGGVERKSKMISSANSPDGGGAGKPE